MVVSVPVVGFTTLPSVTAVRPIFPSIGEPDLRVVEIDLRKVDLSLGRLHLGFQALLI